MPICSWLFEISTVITVFHIGVIASGTFVAKIWSENILFTWQKFCQFLPSNLSIADTAVPEESVHYNQVSAI